MFLQVHIAAPAELILENGSLTIFEGEASVLTNDLAIGRCDIGGAVRHCQYTGCCRSIVPDFLLRHETHPTTSRTSRSCSVMGRHGFDFEGERDIVEQAAKQIVHVLGIHILLHHQSVFIREVEGDLHVGFPQAPLHVEHGQGVLRTVEITTLKRTGEGGGHIFSRTVTGILHPADRGVSILKIDGAFHPAVVAADIQNQLTVHKHPDIIITGEVEHNRFRITRIIRYRAILCQAELDVKPLSKAIVQPRFLTRLRACVKGEVAGTCSEISTIAIYRVVGGLEEIAASILLQLEVAVCHIGLAAVKAPVVDTINFLLDKGEGNVVIDLSQDRFFGVAAG